MRIIKRIIQATIIVILAVGIPYLCYLLYVTLDRPNKDPVQAIPDRTALIIQVNHPLGLLGELTRNNLIWKELLTYPGIRPIQDQLLLIDSMSRWSPEIREILNDAPLTIALSLHSRTKFDPLFLMPVPSSLEGSSFTSFIEEHYPGKITILQSPYNLTEIYRIHFENQRNTLFAAVWEGICIFSFTDALVKRAIDQLSLNTAISVMKGFNTVSSTTGKKVDANLYVNFPYLSLALWKSVNEQHNNGLVKFARYADWSGMDLYLKKDGLLFNGYTIASDSAMQTLALINDQVPVSLTMTGILPSNTEIYLLYAMIGYPEYFQRWQLRLQRAAFSVENIDLFNGLNSRYDTLVLHFLESWIGHQVGRCWIKPSPTENGLHPVTILQTANPDSARKSLLSLSQTTGKKIDSTSYEGVPIYQTNLSEILNIWLSPLFEQEELAFFTIIGDFVCFSHSRETLKEMLKSNLKREFLIETKVYQDISENISDQANFSFYCNSNHLLDELPVVLNTEYLPLFSPILGSLKKFQSFTLQLSAEDGMFYTSFQVRFNPKNTEEGPLAWKTNLDTLVSGRPQIVHSGAKDSFSVLVTDTMNTLYKIDPGGQIAWKQKLYGKVLGSFHEVILPSSDSLFYLFNTENHLYLIRSDGKSAPRFPMKFPVQASNGLSVITPGEFNIVIAFRNKRIYSFNFDGGLSEGWTSPEVEELVVTPIQVLRGRGGSLIRTASRENPRSAVRLFATMKSGKILITDEFGVKKVDPEKGFYNSPNSAFYVNLTNSKSPWLTTDVQGNVSYFEESGRVSSVSFNTFSANHYFLYEDILGDGAPEFIFFDNNTLFYYDHFFKLIYFYSFRHNVSPPCLIKKIHGNTYLGFTSQTTNEVFLFDRQGYVEIESGVKGTTPFDLGFLNNDNSLYLVIGSNRSVKGFSLGHMP